MTDRDHEDISKDKSSQSQEKVDRLSKNEKMAFEKIMAEINGDNKSETPEPEPVDQAPEPQAESGELDDEQQAALDKIMAEINGGGDVQTPSPAPGTDHNDEIISAEDGPDENAAEQEQTSPGQTNLSLKEFDDELNNLLSAANAQVDASESETTPASEKKPQPESEKGNASETFSEIEAALSDSVEGQPDPQGRKHPGKPPPSDAESDSEYAILHAITISEAPDSAKRRQKVKPKGGNRKPRTGRKLVRYAAAALVLFSMAGAGYGYHAFRTKAASPALLAPEASLADPAAPARPQIPLRTEPEHQAPLTPLQPAAAMSVPTSESPAMATFVSLKENIASTRQHILNKIEEIRALKAYYQNGIKEEHKKIRAVWPGKTLPPLEAALEKRQIGLGLLAIQRRKVYATKLEAPIKLLTSSSEELLYLERKTRLFETLNQGVSGLAITEFAQEVAEIIANHLKASHELSVDDIPVPPPSLDALWAELKSEHAGTHDTPEASPADRALDQQITEEICAGRFERKYLLSELTPESAQCLAKWTGKDLYLNSLTDLPPSVAKIISQWRGEWLCFNGIKTLSADSAKYLAQWKGKRLSLNGLARLSRGATSHLSKWKGEQLEMVGLEKIGRWENHGTRLYLSERLRLKLHVQ